jgi:hypothetical protein
MWGLRQILKLNQGPLGAAKFSFSIMRQQLISKFHAERISVPGNDGNKIDGILVPCKEQYERLSEELAASDTGERQGGIESSRKNSLSSSSSSSKSGTTPRNGPKPHSFPPSPLGTVLFCSPNAGLYECLSQAAKDSSWVGYYTSLGFDVCLFNYR